jgi:hypothetical protein
MELQCERHRNPMFDHPEFNMLGREEADEPFASTLSVRPTTLGPQVAKATTTAIMRTTINSLAVELIDAIIGYVDEKDDISRNHLLSCSLVCRLWISSSQRRLFHHIKFGRFWYLGQTHPGVQQLDQVLVNSPHLASYIRVLELPNLSSSRLSEYSRYRGGIGTDELLSPLLPKLTQVQKLKISGLSWNDSTGDFRQSLRRVLELPSMAFVCISDAQFIGADDFMTLLNHTRGLLGLSLKHIHVPPHSLRVETNQGEDNKETFERQPLSHLTFLDTICSVWDGSSFFDWIHGPRSHFRISHIHTLHMSTPFTEDDSVNRLLRAIGSSLRHVFILLSYLGE